MHLTMGGVELSDVKWDEAPCVLSGVAHRAPGAKGRVFVNVPKGWGIASGATPRTEGVAAVEIDFAARDEAWAVRFKKGM